MLTLGIMYLSFVSLVEEKAITVNKILYNTKTVIIDFRHKQY